MKKTTRALTLLTAVSLTFGSALTITPMVTAVEAQEQTMADQYQPYFEDLTFKRIDDVSRRTILKSDQTLPEGTTFKLLNTNLTDTTRRDRNIITSVHEYSKSVELRAQHVDYYEYNAAGDTTVVEVSVTYPDGSSEVISSIVTIIPTQAQVASVHYYRVRLTPGETKTFSPDITKGYRGLFTLVEDSKLSSAIDQGWSIEIDQSTGKITSTAPAGESYVTLNVLASFGDSSSSIESVYIDSEQFSESRAFGSSSS